MSSDFKYSCGWQHCLVIPTEESLTIYSPTRSANVCQIAVAGVTGLQTSRSVIALRTSLMHYESLSLESTLKRDVVEEHSEGNFIVQLTLLPEPV